MSQNYREPVLDENFEQESVVHGAFIDGVQLLNRRTQMMVTKELSQRNETKTPFSTYS